ncbi:DUF4190 domain-containing protein [Nocardia sp. NBC_01327]|uniref:DUF4190 domain-containing protein n=1 Tax=Nocardia sp. NBC_01327 TaxID=2903593 RepID=UPI002E167674|nr:DUF4190 domain-containing protein [Nocardia sp. NBC_01327]
MYPAPPSYTYQAPLPVPPQGTSGWAIATLITGLFGLCLVAVPLGVIALIQIKDRNQRGKRLAIVGLVLAGVWAVAAVAVAGVALRTSAGNDESAAPPSYSIPSPTSASPTSAPLTSASLLPTAPGVFTLIHDWKDGDCLNGVHRATAITGAQVTDCSAPHDGEVFRIFSLPSWESEQQVRDYAETKCAELFDPMAAKSSNISYVMYHPYDQNDWRVNPLVQCVAIDVNGGQLTGKLPR